MDRGQGFTGAGVMLLKENMTRDLTKDNKSKGVEYVYYFLKPYKLLFDIGH